MFIKATMAAVAAVVAADMVALAEAVVVVVAVPAVAVAVAEVNGFAI
jgi:hypothetical protein